MTPRRLLTWSLLFLILLQLAVQVARSGTVNDFIAYWSAARVTALGGNAYDPATIQNVQVATGYGSEEPVQVWNPPWTPVLFLPLALLPLMWARALWAVVSMGMLWVAGYWLSLVYWPGAGRLARLVAITLPAIVVHAWVAMMMGQISALVLFGLAGALYFYHRSPVTSGALLVLATVKPQLCIGALFLFGLRALFERNGRFIGGAVGTVAGMLALLTLLRPSWLLDYQEVLAEGLLDWSTPTLASWLRVQAPTLPVVPLFLGLATLALLAIALWSLRTLRWEDGVAAAVMVTLFFSIFGWSFDQIVLLIPIFHLFGRLRAHGVALATTAGLLLAINVMTYLVRMPTSVDEYLFFWVVPAVGVVYLLGMLVPPRRQERSSELSRSLHPL